MKNMIENINSYERGLIDRLGNWITVWYPSIPKTYGLYFMRDYLEQRHAWQKFLTNFHMVGKRKGFVQVFEYILRTKDVTNLLQWAFDWKETKEGETYWAKINLELEDIFTMRKEDGYKLTQAYAKEMHTTNLFSKSISDACSILTMLGATNQNAHNSSHTIYIGSVKEEKIPFSVPLTSTTIISIAYHE